MNSEIHGSNHEFDELKSLLLQVDQSLGVSQLLLMGTLSNFTLSKRQEMLDKSPIPELADLLRYPEGFPEPFFIGPVSEWN
jgi:hypothetical protein